MPRWTLTHLTRPGGPIRLDLTTNLSLEMDPRNLGERYRVDRGNISHLDGAKYSTISHTTQRPKAVLYWTMRQVVAKTFPRH